MAPANKLRVQERTAILAVANSSELASIPPSRIVPTLAGRGQYLASDPGIYRIVWEQAGRPSYCAAWHWPQLPSLALPAKKKPLKSEASLLRNA